MKYFEWRCSLLSVEVPFYNSILPPHLLFLFPCRESKFQTEDLYMTEKNQVLVIVDYSSRMLFIFKRNSSKSVPSISSIVISRAIFLLFFFTSNPN